MIPRRLRYHLAAVLLWTLFCGLFFATLLLGWERLPPGDFTGQFHAFARFQAREMAQGNLPLWSPGSYGGFPFAGDVQAAAFYPLRWLSILLSLPWGFSLYVLQMEAIAHIWLAGTFTYALGYALTRSRPAGLLAAVAFALGGYLTAYPLLQLAILETIAWLPLILLFIWVASRRRHPLRWLLGAGLLLALSALAGHPQTFLHVAYVTALYYLFRAVQARWSLRWIVGGGLLLALVAAGVAAVSWLPALRWALFSTRAGVSYEFVAAGQPMLNYLQLFVPGVRAFWSPEYAGVATVVVVLVAWFGRGSIDRRAGSPLLPGGRAEVVFWAVLALMAAWLAMGDDGLLFRLVYRVAPGFSLFRRQERLLGVASFSLALTAAQGLALWRRLPSRQRRRVLLPAAVVFAAGMLATGAYLLSAPGSDAVGIWWRQWAIAALVVLLLWVERRHRLLVLGLLLLLGADLYVGTYTAIDRRPGRSVSYWRQPAWLQRVPHGPEPARIDTQGHFFANVGEIYGLEDVRGLSPLKPRLLDQLERLPRRRFWRLLGVTHVVSDEPPEARASRVAAVQGSLEPGRTVQASLYALADPLPRAWLSYEPVQAAGGEQALEILADPGFDPARQVVVHTDLPHLSGVTRPEAAPGVRVRRLQANELRIDVETETRGLLVVSEWRYPGWRATLDGAPATLYPADYGFQAVLVPVGSHTLTLRFVPADVVAGGLVTALVLIVVSVLAWRWQPVVGVRQARRLPALPLGAPALPAGVQGFGGRVLSFVAVHRRTLLLATVFCGFVLRFFHLGAQELRGGEATSFLLARMPLAEIVPGLVAGGDLHSPLHYLLLGGWLRLAGDSEFAMRVPSALASVLLLPLAFHLGRRLWSARLGLLLSSLFAVSQSQIWLAQDVRGEYVLALLFTLLATLLLARAASGDGGGPGVWLLYVLFSALALYSHPYTLFVLAAQGLALLTARRLRRFGAWIVAAVTALLLYLPWPVLAGGVRIGQPGDPGGVDFAPYLYAAGTELLAGPALATATSRWFVLGAAFLCLQGLTALGRRRRFWAALLGGWLSLTVLGIYLVTLRGSPFRAFTIALAAPAWWALFAAGAAALWQQRGRLRLPARVLAAAAIIVAIVLSSVSLERYYGHPVEHGKSAGYRRLAAHVTTRWRPGDLFLANSPDPSLVYYLRHAPLSYQVQPESATVGATETEQTLASLAAAHGRLWFVPAPGASRDSREVALRWLDHNLLLEEERRFQELTLQAYRPLHAVDQLLLPLEREMGGVLRLEGAYVTVNGRRPGSCEEPVRAAPGATLDVSLLWRALAPVAEDYTVFVHLLGADGRLLTQHDGVPVHGTRPTTTWVRGERILDEHELVLPEDVAAGEQGTLVVGAYDSATLERQPFAGGEDAVQLCNIVVSP